MLFLDPCVVQPLCSPHLSMNSGTPGILARSAMTQAIGKISYKPANLIWRIFICSAYLDLVQLLSLKTDNASTYPNSVLWEGLKPVLKKNFFFFLLLHVDSYVDSIMCCVSLLGLALHSTETVWLNSRNEHFLQSRAWTSGAHYPDVMWPCVLTGRWASGLVCLTLILHMPVCCSPVQGHRSG